MPLYVCSGQPEENVFSDQRRHVQEVWGATQEQVAANHELLKHLSTRAGLPADSHADGDSSIQRMQALLCGAQSQAGLCS